MLLLATFLFSNLFLLSHCISLLRRRASEVHVSISVNFKPMLASKKEFLSKSTDGSVGHVGKGSMSVGSKGLGPNESLDGASICDALPGVRSEAVQTLSGETGIVRAIPGPLDVPNEDGY